MKKYILYRYLKLPQDNIIVWHHASCHSRNIIFTIIGILILWVLYSLSQYFFPSVQLLTTIWAIAGCVLYLRFLVVFVNRSLDSIVFWSDWITIVKRHQFFNYSIQHYTWPFIDTIYYNQSHRSHKLRRTGDLYITTIDDERLSFFSIFKPWAISKLIVQQQHTPDGTSSTTDNSKEKINILVESLGEVIKEYIEQSSDEKN